MPISKITSQSIADGTVIASDILDDTITSAKIVSLANTKISGNIIASQITSVANTQLTGNIIASQITSVANTQITGSITGSQIEPNIVLNGAVTYMGSAIEEANLRISNVTSNITFNPYDQAILYFLANTTANSTITVNFVGLSPLISGNVLTASILLTNNATYNAYISAVQIEGSAATSVVGVGARVLTGGTPTGNVLRWQTSRPTTGTANIDAYTFSIVKNAANSYTVLGSKSTFD